MEEKKEITLWINREIDRISSDKYGHIIGRVMIKHADETLRNWRYEWGDKPFTYFDNLEVSCQQDPTNDAPTYGWRIGYKNLYSIELDEAEKIVKTLKVITKSMDKMNVQFGRCSCFADYVIRFYHAVKAESVCFTVLEGDGGWLHKGQYRFETDMATNKYKIKDMIEENLKEIGSKLVKTEEVKE